MAEEIPILGWCETCDFCKYGIELDREYPCSTQEQANKCPNYKELQEKFKQPS